ncbi:uridine kinase family protein [Clostridium minihomine]|uniref:uridine kinase family protein n=1 Tax=Clostridium minihomine TaxID=2045012 RepID=UPI000C79103A|nr:nucleoside kinase [Clostridium minihomine]
MNYFANSYVKYVDHMEQINEAAKTDPVGMVEQIESAYRRYLSSIAMTITENPERYKIILLAGPSSSGKTTTMEILKEMLERQGVRCATISLDNFYRGENQAPLLESGERDYESVDALNLPVLEGCLLDLIGKGHCEIPVFDFMNRRPSSQTLPVALPEKGVAIFEGIHGLNPRVSAHLPKDRLLKLYISVKQDIKDSAGVVLSHNDLRFVRRVVRDYSFRGTGPERTFDMWKNVLDGENKYIRPFKSVSNITINSIHMYEPCVLRGKAIPLLRQIPPESPHYNYACWLISQLERFVPMEETLVPHNSILREFVGGSVYHEEMDPLEEEYK